MTTLVYPATLTAGANENVNDLNANLNAVSAVVNGNIDQSNLAAGAVTVPKLGTIPAAKVLRTTVATVPTATTAAIAFDNESYDNDTIHDNVTNNTRLTCKTAGVYTINAGVEWATNATGLRYLFVRVNGGAASIAGDIRAPASGDITLVSVVATQKLAVNDYIEVYVRQTSGANLDVGITSLLPYVSMTWESAG